MAALLPLGSAGSLEECLEDIHNQSMAALGMTSIQQPMGPVESDSTHQRARTFKQQMAERRSETAFVGSTFMEPDLELARLQEKLMDTQNSDSMPKLMDTHGSDGVPPERSCMSTAHNSLSMSTDSPLSHVGGPNGTSQAKPPKRDTRILVQPAHCPAQLKRERWSVDQFQLEKVLYVGDISRVVRAVEVSTGVTVALKVYKRSGLSDMEKYQVAREIRTHSELQHEHIIGLYAAWKDSQYIHMVVEWAPHGDLWSHMQWSNEAMPEETVVTKIFRPLLAALQYIHRKGLIHRDLKPENILLGPNYSVKLADFGLSIDNHAEVANTRLGTLNYIAPEVLNYPYKRHPLDNKNRDAAGYDNKVDVWSLGVLAFELLTRQLPFNSNSLEGTLQRILRCDVTLPQCVNPCAADFVMLCLQKDGSRRPSVNELLHHPWIASTFPRAEH